MENRLKIEGLLKDNPRGLTIQDLADKSKLSRNTIMVILARFFGENKLELRQIGNAKLHFWKYKPLPKNQTKEMIKEHLK
jgi:DNA-binding transcriptional ArsR family regulator